jgi:hypothetical protein
MENFDRVNGHLELDDILVSLYLDLPVCFVILHVCFYTYEFGLSLCKIVRSSVILLLPLIINHMRRMTAARQTYIDW